MTNSQPATSTGIVLVPMTAEAAAALGGTQSTPLRRTKRSILELLDPALQSEPPQENPDGWGRDRWAKG